MGVYTNDPNFLTVYLIVLTFKYIWNQISLPSLLNYTISFPQRILCETVKDIVAKVEKAYEKTLEKAVVADAVASKVSGTCSGHGSFFTDYINTELCFTAKWIRWLSCQDVFNQEKNYFWISSKGLKNILLYFMVTI